jgi:hypothetical protein
MKTVFSSNYDCIHAFAQRSQDKGRSSSGNVFFERNTLYSYGHHFELAKFVGENLVLINDTSYSVYTSKHQSITRQALRQYQHIYISSWDIMKVNSRLETLKDKLSKAKKPEIYISEALNLIQAHKESQAIYPNKSVSYTFELPKLQEYEALFNNSVNVEKLKERQAKIRQEQQEMFQQFKTAFINFKPYEALKWKAKSKYDLIRISSDNQFIETSQNVKIDISEAKKLYKALSMEIDIVGQKIGYYTIHANRGSYLKIGCHNIKLNHIHETMQTL